MGKCLTKRFSHDKIKSERKRNIKSREVISMTTVNVKATVRRGSKGNTFNLVQNGKFNKDENFKAVFASVPKDEGVVVESIATTLNLPNAIDFVNTLVENDFLVVEKRGRGRPKKMIDPNAPVAEKKPRGRPKKVVDPNAPIAEKKPRGRPRKILVNVSEMLEVTL